MAMYMAIRPMVTDMDIPPMAIGTAITIHGATAIIRPGATAIAITDQGAMAMAITGQGAMAMSIEAATAADEVSPCCFERQE